MAVGEEEGGAAVEDKLGGALRGDGSCFRRKVACHLNPHVLPTVGSFGSLEVKLLEPPLTFTSSCTSPSLCPFTPTLIDFRCRSNSSVNSFVLFPSHQSHAPAELQAGGE